MVRSSHEAKAQHEPALVRCVGDLTRMRFSAVRGSKNQQYLIAETRAFAAPCVFFPTGAERPPCSWRDASS
eukprot:4235562-Pleurochrysis_carterae.AAC.2